MDVVQALSDLRDIQQLIQDKYVKQFPDDGNNERTNFSQYKKYPRKKDFIVCFYFASFSLVFSLFLQATIEI